MIPLDASFQGHGTGLVRAHTNYNHYISFICLILVNFTNLAILFITLASYYYTCPAVANLGLAILRCSLFYSVYPNDYWGRDRS